MPRSFQKLTRPAQRALLPNQEIIEHGIRFKRLPNGDGRYTIDLMVEGQRIHRVIGLESEGITRTDAETYIEKLKTEARENRLGLPKGRKNVMSLKEASDKYLERLKATGGKNIDKKTQHLEQHLVPFFGRYPLAKITLDDTSEYRIHRKKQTSKRGAPPSDTTINRELATLSHLLTKAVDWGWIQARPRKVGLVKEENERTEALTPAECRRLLKNARLLDHQLYTFIKIGLSTGMRSMEILSIRLEYINLKDQTIYLPVTKTGPATQIISAELAKYLQWYIAHYVPENTIWLFPSKLGSARGHRTAIDDSFRTAVELSELDPKKITPHVMRHTYGSHLGRNNIDAKTRMELMRHKTPHMMYRYDHVNQEQMKKAADIVEQAMQPKLEVV